MSPYDYLALGFYFAFMVAIGWFCRSFVTNASEYFRGGGKMLWWMAGGSAFMTQFSAWTFTGAASKAYTDGPVIFAIFFGNALGFFINYLWFAAKFRQLRCITPVEAIRQRFGRGNEQFFTWLQLPTGTVYAAIWLNGLAVFAATVFGLPKDLTVIGTGFAVLLISAFGGAWAVAASDFIQLLLLMLITVVAAAYALHAVGGPGPILERFPAETWYGQDVTLPALAVAWVLFMFIKQFTSTNSLFDSNRYLCARDSANARGAALFASVLFIIGPVVWFIPPMAAAVLYPNLGEVVPAVAGEAPRKQAEVAFVATAMNTLPAGMIGIILSGMFAATMSSMDSGLNRNAGIFIRNFYLPVINPHASEKVQLVAGKAATWTIGLLVIGIAWWMTHQKIPLFTLMVNFGALVGTPIAVPLILGIWVRKTPDWAAWSTVLVGLGCSLLVAGFPGAFDGPLGPKAFGGWIGQALSERERGDYDAVAGLLLVLSVCSAWFMSTKLWRRPKSARREAELARLDANLATPVLAPEDGGNLDAKQLGLLGWLAVAYGAFLAAMALVPNDAVGRLAYLGLGGAMAGVGGWMLVAARAAKARDRAEAAANPTPPPS